MAQSSDSAAKPKRKRGPGRPFPPGVSGNPSGKPKGFGVRIREVTQDGEELVTIALAIARGKLALPLPEDAKEGEQPEVQVPTPKERLAAVAWLADRGWGKAEQPLVGKDGEALSVSVVINRGGRK